MADRPILFSGPMVRALLDGRKTQTRRLLKPKKHACLISEGWTDDYVLDPGNREWLAGYYLWRVGDRLWVKETWCRPNGSAVRYAATDDVVGCKLRPSIFMFRSYSRLTLTVTDVRVQRLQEISEEDARAEGAGAANAGHDLNGVIKSFRTGFVGIWQEINGNWLDNPWVVAVTFRAAQHNIDQVSRLTVSCTDAGSIRA